MRHVALVFAFTWPCVNAVTPWTALHFATQERPSHVNGSVVVRDLLSRPTIGRRFTAKLSLA